MERAAGYSTCLASTGCGQARKRPTAGTAITVQCTARADAGNRSPVSGQNRKHRRYPLLCQHRKPVFSLVCRNCSPGIYNRSRRPQNWAVRTGSLSKRKHYRNTVDPLVMHPGCERFSRRRKGCCCSRRFHTDPRCSRLGENHPSSGFNPTACREGNGDRDR